MSKYQRFLPQVLRRDSQPAAPPHLYKYKTRFSMLGTVGSGKTTISACIVLTAQTLSSLWPNFKCRVLENTTGILEATSNLRRGRFPPKTVTSTAYALESGLLMKWTSTFSDKKVQIPICDLAGEDIQAMIKRFSKNMYAPTPESFAATNNLIKYVKDSDGFILCVPASRALLFQDDTQIEPEPEDMQFDPDVNLARILESVISHKEHSKGKPIKGIAVVITKWDLIAPYASNWGMDLYDPSGEGLERFMEVCFPDTSMLLKYYGLDNVRFFPSYVQVMRDDKGNLQKWPDGNYKIEVIQENRVPKYAEQSYVNLLEYLKTFAT